MKKGLIVINSFNRSAAYLYEVKRLVEEFASENIVIDVKKSEEIDVIVSSTIDINLSMYDFCIFLDKDIYLAKAIEKSGLKLFNSSKAIEYCDNKMLTHIMLSKHGIKMPKTIPGLLSYIKDSEISEVYLNRCIKELGFPMVFKKCYGSLGKEVFLINNKMELIEALTKYKNESYLLQEYISSSCGKDLRVICIGGKFLSCMLRENNEDFRSNIGYGGKGSQYVPDGKYLKLAEKCSRILKLDYCGIDILFGKNGNPCLCEVNSNAFFEELEKITKVNVAKEYAKYIIREVYNK